jgi:hypothetical protein
MQQVSSKEVSQLMPQPGKESNQPAQLWKVNKGPCVQCSRWISTHGTESPQREWHIAPHSQAWAQSSLVGQREAVVRSTHPRAWLQPGVPEPPEYPGWSASPPSLTPSSEEDNKACHTGSWSDDTKWHTRYSRMAWPSVTPDQKMAFLYQSYHQPHVTKYYSSS